METARREHGDEYAPGYDTSERYVPGYNTSGRSGQRAWTGALMFAARRISPIGD
jgi:hypothetical protein